MLRTDRISRTDSGRLNLKHLTDEDEKGPPGDPALAQVRACCL